MCDPNVPTAVETAVQYHERTKHHPHRYARSLGYLDWATQPDPFRRFVGAPLLHLDHPDPDASPRYDALFTPRRIPPEPVNRDSVSHLFYESLAISAWKQAPGTNPWPLRCDPSSGNLHPTEGYLIAGPIDGVSDTPAVYHYFPFEHALERRAAPSTHAWAGIARGLPPGALLVALTSIYWRESWKYGERAYRYCHHDAGHVIGAVTIAAAALGWSARLVTGVSDAALAALIGVADQHGVEAEHPDALMAVYPSDEVRGPGAIHLNLPDAVLDHLRSTAFTGRPNRLSKDHHPWPIIDAVAAAAAYDGTPIDTPPDAEPPTPSTPRAERDVNARRIIRGRRSAVSMDGKTEIPAETFYHMLDRLTATTPRLPYDVLPWRPRVSLALFVHRVVGVAPGIYLLIRHPSHEPSLRVSIRPELAWARPADCPEHIPLVRLLDEDVRDLAGFASCQQAIAADGVFAAAMLAQLEPALTEYGPWFYPRLFWETGLIGQVLYLEAEAAGIRGTGMGCFYDDVVHETLGLPDRTWQSLYHFTVGGAREDLRLQTLPAYAHLTRPGT